MDETKQQFIRNKFKDQNEKLRYFIGDIREKDRIVRAMEGVDIVFHLAALLYVYAFSNLKLEEIKLGVYKNNIRAIHTYKKTGFKIYEQNEA